MFHNISYQYRNKKYFIHISSHVIFRSVTCLIGINKKQSWLTMVKRIKIQGFPSVPVCATDNHVLNILRPLLLTFITAVGVKNYSAVCRTSLCNRRHSSKGSDVSERKKERKKSKKHKRNSGAVTSSIS